MSKDQSITMDELLASSDVKQLKIGDVAEGLVISVKKHEAWVDLGVNGVGVGARGEQYPHLLRDNTQVDVLDEIIKPQTTP